MEIEKIKMEILDIYPKWKELGNSFDDDKYAEVYEGCVWDLIVSYCEKKGYEVEGYPFQKRIIGKTNDFYDEAYFCYERKLKYLNILALTHDDVFELMYFFIRTFWADQIESREEYREYLLEGIAINRYDIEF